MYGVLVISSTLLYLRDTVSERRLVVITLSSLSTRNEWIYLRRGICHLFSSKLNRFTVVVSWIGAVVSGHFVAK